MSEAIRVQERLTLPQHGDFVITPVRVRVREALDETFVVRVEAEVPDVAEVPILVGGDAIVELVRGDAVGRRFCGVIQKVEELASNPGNPIIVELYIVPALAYLAQRRDTRIFQEKSAPEILEEILGAALGDFNRSVDLRLDGEHPTREYCLQYQETDLQFAQRLMEEEGIHYSFDHEGDVELMVLGDSNEVFVEVASGARIAYQPDAAEMLDREVIHRFERINQAITTSVVGRDWDWSQAASGMMLESEERGEDEDGRDRESYEHGEARSFSITSYDAGVRRYQEQDGDAQAKARLEAHARDHVVTDGASGVMAMQPGVTFEIVGHPTVGMDGSYLVLRATHDTSSTTTDDRDPYRNWLRCIPAKVPHRPPRREQKPRIHGIQTAVCTGPAGEEIHVDEHGRIKAQFHWDRVGENDEHSSLWIRVRQPWAGDGWGFWWVPRIGMEVMVQFVDGDPDRPLVTGCLYDGANPTPYGLPDEKTKSTIKSNSSLGGDGSNEFRFEDKKGEEEIYTHAEKDYNEVVEHDHNTLVHNCQTNEVDGDQTQTIHRNQTETVDVDQELTVDGNRTLHIKTNFDETVNGTETRHTVGDVTETFESNETRDISLNVTEDISGNETRDITGNQTETIGGSHTLTVSGGGGATDTASGAWNRTVTGGITTITPASFDITAIGGHSVTAAGGINYIAPAGITIIAPGGVQRADSFWDVYCGSHVSMGVLKTEAFIMKLGICTGISIALVGLKGEDTGMALSATGCDLANHCAMLKKRGVDMVLSGADLGNKFVLKMG